MLIKFCYYHNGIQIVVNEDLTFNPILRIMEFKVLFIVSFLGGGGGAFWWTEGKRVQNKIYPKKHIFSQSLKF